MDSWVMAAAVFEAATVPEQVYQIADVQQLLPGRFSWPSKKTVRSGPGAKIITDS